MTHVEDAFSAQLLSSARIDLKSRKSGCLKNIKIILNDVTPTWTYHLAGLLKSRSMQV